MVCVTSIAALHCKTRHREDGFLHPCRLLWGFTYTVATQRPSWRTTSQPVSAFNLYHVILPFPSKYFLEIPPRSPSFNPHMQTDKGLVRSWGHEVYIHTNQTQYGTDLSYIHEVKIRQNKANSQLTWDSIQEIEDQAFAHRPIGNREKRIDRGQSRK